MAEFQKTLESWPSVDRPIDCSVVIPTFNRADQLREALDGLRAQQCDGLRFEVIAVDNGSTDSTRAMIESYGSDLRITYVLEAERGPSAGRNAGIARATGRIVAFMDDDVRVEPGWIAAIVTALDAEPEVDAIAGRILPRWPSAPPSWLTGDHWVGPLALQDYGDRRFVIDARRPLALAAANLAFRRSLLNALGGFDRLLHRAEDTHLLLRLWRLGGRCLYLPEALAIAAVAPERTTKRYHRAWHHQNGKWTAAIRFGDVIDHRGSLLPAPVDAARLYGVPSYMLREFAVAAAGWLAAVVCRQHQTALEREYRMRYLAGYITYTVRNYAHRPYRWLFHEIAAFSMDLFHRKRRQWSESRPPHSRPQTGTSAPSKSVPAPDALRQRS
jgi:GT2 family glycosyltransferase